LQIRVKPIDRIVQSEDGAVDIHHMVALCRRREEHPEGYLGL